MNSYQCIYCWSITDERKVYVECPECRREEADRPSWLQDDLPGSKRSLNGKCGQHPDAVLLRYCPLFGDSLTARHIVPGSECTAIGVCGRRHSGKTGFTI